MGLDLRIGRSFLSPGPGFGGSCFPSQVRALPELAGRIGVETPVMAAVAASNDGQADWLLDRLETTAGRAIAGWRVALLGLTFKADTDDLRESPALRLARRLAARGASVVCFDPVATAPGVAMLRAEGLDVSAADSADAACAGADAVVVATEWPQFRVLEWREIRAAMRGTYVLDARHVVDVDEAIPCRPHGHLAGRGGSRIPCRPRDVTAFARTNPGGKPGRGGTPVSGLPAPVSGLPAVTPDRSSPISAAEVARTRQPVDRASMLPPRAFHDQDVFDFEQEAWFARDWVCVGREEDAARSGEYFLASVAGESLVVVRGEDQQLRAFHNVCRHRGSRILTEENGHVVRFQCPYHAWTYNLAGALRRPPHTEQLVDFEPEHNGLVPVRLTTWLGFVFLTLEPGG